MSPPGNREAIVAQLRTILGHARMAAADVADTLARIDPANPDKRLMMALGAYVHHYWNQTEKMAEKFVLEANGEVPAGEDSHARTLQRALPVADRSERLFSDDLRADLDALRKFRHFFRHAYPVPLDWDLLEQDAERVAKTLPLIERDVAALAARWGVP